MDRGTRPHGSCGDHCGGAARVIHVHMGIVGTVAATKGQWTNGARRSVDVDRRGPLQTNAFTVGPPEAPRALQTCTHTHTHTHTT